MQTRRAGLSVGLKETHWPGLYSSLPFPFSFFSLLPPFLFTCHPFLPSPIFSSKTSGAPASRKGHRCLHSDCWPSLRGLWVDLYHWLILKNKAILMQRSQCFSKDRSPQRKLWVRNKGAWREGSTLLSAVLQWPSLAFSGSSLFLFFKK